MSRRERTVFSVACVLAMAVLWWSVGLSPVWAWSLRIGAVLGVPGTFFGIVAAQMMRQISREEAGLTKEEVRARRRAAAERSQRDVFPLLSRPDRYARPLLRAWEVWAAPKPPKQPPPAPQDRTE